MHSDAARRKPVVAVSIDAESFSSLKLAIEYLPPAEVQSYARNARTHTKRQIHQIAESIRAFGFISPLVVDRGGTIIAGHGRLAAARLVGLKAVPVVRVEHLDEPQKRALRIADNRLAELAGWDRDLLAIEFSELLSLDLDLSLNFDVAVTGFDSPDIDQLIENSKPGCGDDEDEAPAVDANAPAVSRPGDIWLLDQHRLICGDSRDAATYQLLLNGERAAMGIHDSPYNVSVTRHVTRSKRHKEFAMGVGELDKAGFTAFLSSFLKEAAAVSVPGAFQFAFMDWRHVEEMLTAGGAAGLTLKNLCVWNKGVGAMGSLYRSQHELVFAFADPRGPGANNVQLGRFGRNRTNVWDYPGAVSLRKELALHPTPKPVSLIADAIRDVSNRHDIVLDAFSGSGTTIMAASKTDRRAYAIELEPHYVDVGVRRWEAWSGGQARHENTGLTFAQMAEQRPSQRSAPPASPPAARIRRRTPAHA